MRRTPMRVCEICTSEYRPTYHAQRTCGRACGTQVNRRVIAARTATKKPADRPVRICSVCGGEFARPGRTCGANCATQAKRTYDRAYNLTRPGRSGVRRCGCGNPTPSSRRQKCDACLQSSKRARKLYERKRTHIEREPYTLEEIAIRDRFTCGICKKRVAMTRAVPHRSAPTIDHLIPISEGGPDVKANVQLAHFICNSRRGTGGTVQLLLVG